MSNETSRATPTPWVLGECPDRPADWMDQVLIFDQGRGCIAEVFSHTDWPTTRANAALIVRAVNSYDAMRAALHNLREWVRNPGRDDGPENDAVILAVDAALALAGEVQP